MLYVPSLIAQIGLSQCFWHHFAYTVNWYEGLDRGAPQPRGPPAVCSLRTALLQYTTGYGFDELDSTRKQRRRAHCSVGSPHCQGSVEADTMIYFTYCKDIPRFSKIYQDFLQMRGGPIHENTYNAFHTFSHILLG